MQQEFLILTSDGRWIVVTVEDEDGERMYDAYWAELPPLNEVGEEPRYMVAETDLVDGFGYPDEALHSLNARFGIKRLYVATGPDIRWPCWGRTTLEELEAMWNQVHS